MCTRYVHMADKKQITGKYKNIRLSFERELEQKKMKNGNQKEINNKARKERREYQIINKMRRKQKEKHSNGP